MEKRAVLALVLSFLILIAFSYIGEWTRPPETAKAPEAKAAAKPKPEAPGAPPPAKAPTPETPAPAAPAAPARTSREVKVETPLFEAIFTEAGARLVSLKLKKYRQSLPSETISQFNLWFFEFLVQRYQDPRQAQARPLEMVQVKDPRHLPLGASWQSQSLSTPEDLFCEASHAALAVKPGEEASLKFTGVTPQGLVLTRTYIFRADTYRIDMTVKVENPSDQAVPGHLALALTANFAGEKTGQAGTFGFQGSINQKLRTVKPGDLKEKEVKGERPRFKPEPIPGKVDWLSMDEGYFMSAVVPLNAPATTLKVQEGPDAGLMSAILSSPEEILAPRQASQASYALYFGPKDLDILTALNLGLERMVNFGWLIDTILAKPMLYLLKFFNRYIDNYGWSIIVLTIFLRLVFLWPNHKSYMSMKAMQRIQPRVQEIREKYKNDREAMNRELMALYRAFKVNPLGGCLPMVLQVPVFIALYQVLYYAIEMRHAPFISTLPFTNIVWLEDLSTKDPLLITPIVMGVTMFIQQKMSPTPGDPAQAKMMMFLPIVFTFLFLNFSSGLVLYWMVNNVLSIAQQHYTNKYLA